MALLLRKLSAYQACLNFASSRKRVVGKGDGFYTERRVKTMFSFFFYNERTKKTNIHENVVVFHWSIKQTYIRQ